MPPPEEIVEETGEGEEAKERNPRKKKVMNQPDRNRRTSLDHQPRHPVRRLFYLLQPRLVAAAAPELSKPLRRPPRRLPRTRALRGFIRLPTYPLSSEDAGAHPAAR